MSFAAMLTALLCLQGIFSWVAVTAQAPNDFTPSCRMGNVNENNRDLYQDNWKLLLDTFDYESLYGGLWSTVDEDRDNINFINLLGGVCTNDMVACGPPSQNNWIISQYVSYAAANEVFVRASYGFSLCTIFPGCTKDYVTLYSYDQNSQASSDEITNTTNYNPLFDTAEQSRLEQGGAPSDVTTTLSLTRPSNVGGIYLGIRDEGTCGSVNRIIMYYVVCLARVEGLVIYDETAVPPRSAADMIFNARCAPNAYNVTTLEVTAFSDNSTCSDRAPGGAMCACVAGYLVLDSTACTACPAETYRTIGDSSCLDCPANTKTTAIAAGECECLDEFYRTEDEGPEKECTEPPSECLETKIESVNDTTVTISWGRPSITGRPDYFYKVLHSDPSNTGKFITVNDRLVDTGSTVTHTITGLNPNTEYILRVTTHNGVSDQDPDAHLRRCEVVSTTSVGLPGEPSNVRRLCNVIIWQEPAVTNGNITGYDIQLTPGIIQYFSKDTNFFITSGDQKHPSTLVRVRAYTVAGVGPWTANEAVGCIPSAKALRFELNGRLYLNNTILLVEDIGEGGASLSCVTDSIDCCSGSSCKASFFFPNGSAVASNSFNGFYSQCGARAITLNKLHDNETPLGEYRCEIPDITGVKRNIYINIISGSCPTEAPSTVSTCPNVSVSTCPSCPETTCPTPIAVTATSSPCPVIACPTLGVSELVNRLTCPSSESLPDVRFELGGEVYLNNSMVFIEDIGNGDDASLHCITNVQASGGNFFLPNDVRAPSLNVIENGFGRNRGLGVVRLHMINEEGVQTGQSYCSFKDSNDNDQKLFIYMAFRNEQCSSTTQSTNTSSTTLSSSKKRRSVPVSECQIPCSSSNGIYQSILHIMEVGDYFIIDFSCPSVENSVELTFTDTGNTEAEIIFSLKAEPEQSLAVVRKSAFRGKLVEATIYLVQVTGVSEGVPYLFEYTKGADEAEFRENYAPYFLALILGTLVVVIVVGFIVISIGLHKKVKNQKKFRIHSESNLYETKN